MFGFWASGVFNANFIATSDQIDGIKSVSPDVMSIVQFAEGDRYTDHQKSEMKAVYRIVGLVAGGALAWKAGLLAIVAIILNEFGVVKRLFTRGS